MGQYENVLSPINIGGVEVPNRVVRTAHATGFNAGEMSERCIQYHLARAKGGVGLTILEIMGVHQSSPASFFGFVPTIVEGHKRLMDAMEAAVGVIPDELLLKQGMAADTERLAGARDAILADHKQAKRSVLYGH